MKTNLTSHSHPLPPIKQDLSIPPYSCKRPLNYLNLKKSGNGQMGYHFIETSYTFF